MHKHTRELDDVSTKSLTPVAAANAHVDAPMHSIPRPGGPRRADDVLQMQQVLGNRYAKRAMDGGPSGAGGRPAKAGRTGLPDALRGGLERLSGESLSDVEVHYDSPKPARLHALAYTRGTEIHMGPGQAHHLAHEAWHVVQQKQGRVQPTTRAGTHPVNDNIELEREADTMGRRASQSSAVPGSPDRTVQAVRGPHRPVIQMLSETREPFNGKQVKLNHTRWAREWKLSLFDKDGEGSEVCSILFKLETSLKGGLPKLSIDSMQSRARAQGTGTELLSSIPWAVAKIVEKNPVATRLGHVKLHSGFANIIAYQMTVKKYAEALELRGTEDWNLRRDEAAAALPKSDPVDADEVDAAEEESALVPSKKAAKRAYDISRFPELWADTHVLINSGMFEIDGAMISLWSVADTVSKILESTKLLYDGFHARVDVKDLSELNAQVEELKEQAKLALEASVTRDEEIEY